MRKKKISKKLNFLQTIGILLIVISMSYFAYSTLRVLDRKTEIEKGKAYFIKKAKLIDIKENKKENTSKINTQETKVLVENLNDETQPKKADGDDNFIISNAIGYIEINKLGVILPIFPGTSKKELRAGVGIVENTDYPTDEKNKISVIAGHRGGYNGEQSFLNINELEKGDKIKITTKEKVLTYEVVGQDVIESRDWSKFIREENKTKLMLMACHPYPQNYQRLLVKAELIESENL